MNDKNDSYNGKSFTFTRESLLAVMRKRIEEELRDNVADILNGDTGSGSLEYFKTWFNIKDKGNNELIQEWCILMSEKFFIENPDIEDVLLITQKNEGDITFKQWMASR